MNKQHSKPRAGRLMLWFGFLVFVGVMALIVHSFVGDNVSSSFCNAVYTMFPLTIYDENGEPVIIEDLEITNMRTGQKYKDVWPAGKNTIFSTGERATVSAEGDRIHVYGWENGRSFEAKVVFASDACNIRKLSGPKSVVLK